MTPESIMIWICLAGLAVAGGVLWRREAELRQDLNEVVEAVNDLWDKAEREMKEAGQ